MKKVLLSLVVLAFSLSLAQPFVWPDSWTAAPPSDDQMGGSLTLSEIGEFRTFNPFVSAESTAVADLLFNSTISNASLVTQGPDKDEYIARAASEFSVSDDGTVVDVTLRDGLKWSDGTPITVQDYFFTYQALTDEEVGANGFDSWFIGDDQIIMEVTGDSTMRFTFPKPDRTALPVITFVPAPDHILGEIYRAEGAEGLKAVWGTEVDLTTTVWSSPWVPVSYRPNERFQFVKNEYYGEWNVDGAGRALPYIDELTYNVLESGDAALNLYLAGELDIFNPRTLDDIGVINQAVQNGDINASVIENASPVASSQFIVFNWNKISDPSKQAIFRNPDFRRAMSHLVDREAMVELIYGGAASPMYSNVYTVLDYWINNDVPKYEYDPEAAAQLLKNIGFTSTNSDGTLVNADGTEMSFILATNSGNTQREQIAQIFADSAREIGVNVDFQAIEFSAIVDQLLTEGDDRPFDAILIGLTGGSRDWPFGSNVIPCGTNLHMYNTSGECLTPQEQLMTKLYFEGRETLDTPAAKAIGDEIQRIQSELQPQIYTVSPAAHYSWLDTVGGEHPANLINAIVGSRETVLTYKK